MSSKTASILSQKWLTIFLPKSSMNEKAKGKRWYLNQAKSEKGPLREMQHLSNLKLLAKNLYSVIYDTLGSKA